MINPLGSISQDPRIFPPGNRKRENPVIPGDNFLGRNPTLCSADLHNHRSLKELLEVVTIRNSVQYPFICKFIANKKSKKKTL